MAQLKKIFLVIIVLAGLLSAGLVLAATSSTGVGVGAHIPSTIITCVGDSCNPTTTTTPIIDQVSTSDTCSAGDVSWHISGIAVLPTHLEYWPKDNPSNKQTVTGVASGLGNNVYSAHLAALQALTEYSFIIYADYNGTQISNGVNSVFTSCAVPNPDVIVEARNKRAELDITYPNYDDIAGVVVYRGQTSCPGPEGDLVYRGDGKVAGSQETLIGDNPTHLSRLYGYTTCIFNSAGVYSSGVYSAATRSIWEVNDLAALSGNNQITISWSNPADNTARDFVFKDVRLIRVSGACNNSTGINDGQLLRDGKFDSFVDSGLTNDNDYYYKVFVRNSYNEYSQGICISAKPSLASEMYCPTDLDIYSSNGQVNVNWNNPINKPGAFKLNAVKWVKGNLCALSPAQGEIVYSGVGQGFFDTLVALAQPQPYAYSLFIDYNNGQLASCGCLSLLPEKKEEPPPCLDCLSPQFNFYVNNGALELTPDSQGNLFILPGYPLIIKSPVASAPKAVSSIIITVNGRHYLSALANTQQFYQAILQSPSEEKKFELSINTIFQDGTSAQRIFTLNVLPWGLISDTNSKKTISGAKVSIFAGSLALFSGSGVINPGFSDLIGRYGFMVPNGSYNLDILANGYNNYKSKQIIVVNNVINLDIGLAASAGLPQRFFSLVAGPINAIRAISHSVDQGARYILPAIAVIGLINVASAASWWNWWYLLQFLFTQPWLIFGRRFRKGWGVVYNSITKQPLGLAVVRLYDAGTKTLKQTRVTDPQGRYMFLVDAGSYYVEAEKPGFTFPSDIMANTSDDGSYSDLYHGQVINISDGQQGIIIANIPLDQESIELTDQQILKKNFFAGWQKKVSWLGPLLSAAVCLVSPNGFTFAMLAIHLVIYWVFRRLAEGQKNKDWGVVYDDLSSEPIYKAVTRIISPEYNKILDYSVTDRYGRYGFLAAKNVYYLTADVPGYKRYKTDNIDLKAKEVEEVVGLDMKLEKDNSDISAVSADSTGTSFNGAGSDMVDSSTINNDQTVFKSGVTSSQASSIPPQSNLDDISLQDLYDRLNQEYNGSSPAVKDDNQNINHSPSEDSSSSASSTKKEGIWG